MFGILVDIVSKAQPDFSDGDSWWSRRKARSGSDDTAGCKEDSTLFRCPDCEIVYVAVEKSDCGNCGGTVEAVESSEDDEDSEDR